MGIKGRFEEMRKDDDHQLKDATYPVTEIAEDSIRMVQEPALTSINERLRDDYVTDCARGVARWNKAIQRAGINFELTLPHRAFHRAIGNFAEVKVSPDGRVITQAEWDHNHHDWLPTDRERAFVASLMKPVTEPGKFASWIAPPPRGINNQPIDLQYVRFK
jgi:benzoyl-CoA 2,3-dioxygenase component B